MDPLPFDLSSTPPDPSVRDGRGLLVLGLGSNVGDPTAELARALSALRDRFGTLRVASLYRSAPVSPIPQPDFLNTVAVAPLPDPGGRSFEDSLRATLAFTKELEHRAGRRSGPRDGPRSLDVDVLLWGERRASLPGLDDEQAREGLWRGWIEVPHPRLAERRFVLEPLVELLPELRLPAGERAADRLDAVTDQEVQRASWHPKA